MAAVVLGLAIAWVLFVPVADWLADHDVGSVRGSLHETAIDNARGRLLTLAAGVFAAGALAFTARNFTLSRRTLDVTEQGQVPTATPRLSSNSARTSSTCGSAVFMHWSALSATPHETTRP
jgi:hypothetical protein